jgi:hypothetical protein
LQPSLERIGKLEHMQGSELLGDIGVDDKKTPWLESASELYRPTERPPLVGEVSANFSG